MTFPQEKSEIYVEYIAKQITCTKQYSDPVVVKDTEYTAEDPAYDLNQLKLENDTSLRYGSATKTTIGSSHVSRNDRNGFPHYRKKRF